MHFFPHVSYPFFKIIITMAAELVKQAE
jgi:hypothetical protein